MKHLVVRSDLQGRDIRPPKLLDHWLRLAEGASRALAADEAGLVVVSCPGCGANTFEVAFERFAFEYRLCRVCGSLYVGRRPTARALASHYATSEAAAYRLRYFTEQTASARFRHVTQSRVDWIQQVLDRRDVGRVSSLADIGTLYPGMFAELADTKAFGVLASIDSDERIRELLPATVRTETTGIAFQLVTAFEQLEHEFSPLDALVRWRSMIDLDGLLLLTTRSGSGFDLSLLGGRARYIFVPEHLNLLSLDGIERLMRRAGFELVELSTPGELDVGLVRDALLEGESLAVPEIVRTLVLDRGEEAIRDLQELLQKHRLSSHVRLSARRIT